MTNACDKPTYGKPAELKLLTEAQLIVLREDDKRRQDEYNKERDPDWNLDSFTRKWHSKMKDASYDWRLLRLISDEDLCEVIHWLSVSDEPCNPKGFGRPGKAKELARDIKYAMSPKQRAVAYSIIEKRFNLLG